jgi:hypothetical protein
MLRLGEALPEFCDELKSLLLEAGEPQLAEQVSSLQIEDRCRCGDDFCATFYTGSKPEGSYGPQHRNIVLSPVKGMLILDVVADEIKCVEVLYRDELRLSLEQALP